MTIRYGSLSHCVFCQKQIYKGADSCGNCGARKVPSTNGKYYFLAFAFFFLGIPGGCALGIKLDSNGAAPVVIPLLSLALTVVFFIIGYIRPRWEKLE